MDGPLYLEDKYCGVSCEAVYSPKFFSTENAYSSCSYANGQFLENEFHSYLVNLSGECMLKSSGPFRTPLFWSWGTAFINDKASQH